MKKNKILYKQTIKHLDFCYTPMHTDATIQIINNNPWATVYGKESKHTHYHQTVTMH